MILFERMLLVYPVNGVVTTSLVLTTKFFPFWSSDLFIENIHLRITAFLLLLTFVGVISRLNNTSEDDWPDRHIFRDRAKLQLFISYARDSSVGFRIGRITFTSTLAWFSFFLGSSGLLFRFF